MGIKKMWGPMTLSTFAAGLLRPWNALLTVCPTQVRALAVCRDGFWTGSRDKTCKLWSPHDKGFSASTTLVGFAIWVLHGIAISLLKSQYQ